MKHNFEFNIDFWDSKTESDFYRYRDILVNLSDMDTIQATHFLENVYSSVARDYGDE
jgi:hypothetical protein